MQSLQEGLECAKRKNSSRLKNSDVEKEEEKWDYHIHWILSEFGWQFKNHVQVEIPPSWLAMAITPRAIWGRFLVDNELQQLITPLQVLLSPVPCCRWRRGGRRFRGASDFLGKRDTSASFCSFRWHTGPVAMPRHWPTHAIISSLSLSVSVSLWVRLWEFNSSLSSLSYPSPPTALPTSLSVRRSCLPFSSFFPPCEIYSCSSPYSNSAQESNEWVLTSLPASYHSHLQWLAAGEDKDFRKPSGNWPTKQG